MVGCHNDNGVSAVNFDDADVWFTGLRNFAGLTGALLLVGILANAYLLRLTSRSRFPVCWEAVRLSLRYVCVIDLFLCFVFTSVIMWLWVNFHTGCGVSLSLRCARFDSKHLWRLGILFVGSGVVVVCHQECLLHTFQHETSLINQHSGRTLKLLRDNAIVGAICVVSYSFLPRFAPDIHLSFCIVDGWMSSRTVCLFPLSVAVNVILGVVILSRTSPPEVDSERQDVMQATGGDFSDKAIDSLPLHDYENNFDKITHSRWNRFLIAASASVLTWFVLVAPMAFPGNLLETVFVMVSVSTLYSVWSACSLFRYWT